MNSGVVRSMLNIWCDHNLGYFTDRVAFSVNQLMRNTVVCSSSRTVPSHEASRKKPHEILYYTELKL